MTFTNDVHNYNRETQKLDYIRTDSYSFAPVKSTILVVERNGVKKLIRVKPDPEFVYQVQKTQIKAKDGAEGLAKFLSDPEWKSTAVKLLDAMMDKVKQATLQPWE